MMAGTRGFEPRSCYLGGSRHSWLGHVPCSVTVASPCGAVSWLGLHRWRAQSCVARDRCRELSRGRRWRDQAGALEQRRLLEGRRLSARELLDACRRRAEATEPVVNALVEVDWERGASVADRLDAEPGFLPDAPLRGLVIAHKNLLDTAGVRTTYGSPAFAGHVPTVSHPLVGLLAGAGTVFVGKTNTPEFGAGSHTFNPVHGLTRNPWDPTRSAGGSSGGAAAALACGSLSLADGSDLGGSLRNPASFCGIVGFRPSKGTIPGFPPLDGRLGMGIETWVLVGSGALLAAAIALEMIFIGRLFRASLLATGQKPTLKRVLGRFRTQAH